MTIDFQFPCTLNGTVTEELLKGSDSSRMEGGSEVAIRPGHTAQRNRHRLTLSYDSEVFYQVKCIIVESKCTEGYFR
jgi:hypothetical protein